MLHNLTATLSILIICLNLFFPGNSQTKPTPTLIPKVGDISIKISSPSPGQALQGNISIQGETNVAGFSHGELTFSYTDNPTDTWFLLQEFDAPVRGELFRWDTTTISDGDYNLRLVVTLKDGRRSIVIIPGIRVRNYTPIETDTPAPDQNLNQTNQIQSTPPPIIKTSRPTPTPFPENPISVSQKGLQKIFTQGAIAGFIVIFAVVFISTIKNTKKNR